MSEEIISETLQTIDQTLDILENTVETVTEVVTKTNPFVIAGALVLGAGIGAFVSWKITTKRLTAEYDKELEIQIEKSRAYYNKLSKKALEFETPEDAVKHLIPGTPADSIANTQENMSRTSYHTMHAGSVVTEESENKRKKVELNVFEQQPDFEWDYEVENAIRAELPHEPYVIHFDEFQENEVGNEQVTLTYFQGDDTLCGVDDSPIDNVEYMVASRNLKRFGHGSHDTKVVYVRNDRIETDFEINLSTGYYQMEVEGKSEPDTILQHSRHPNRNRGRGTPKFRGSDE